MNMPLFWAIVFVTLFFLACGAVAQYFIIQPDKKEKTKDSLYVWCGDLGILFMMFMTIFVVTMFVLFTPTVTAIKDLIFAIKSALLKIGESAESINKLTGNAQGVNVGNVASKAGSFIGNLIASVNAASSPKLNN